MRTGERQLDSSEQRQGGFVNTHCTGVCAAPEEVDRLLAAADDAIERALSADSRAFLAGTRQGGGQ